MPPLPQPSPVTIDRATLHHGDCLDVLRTLPGASVQCCVTSPPYFGLRDYGHANQIGMEQTPNEYVAKLVAVFREVRRVLKDDGVCWLNLGDSYVGSTMTGGNNGINASGGTNGFKQKRQFQRKNETPDLKPKDLIGIPWRVAFALQADGWWLRQDIIWHKPNPMPESVRDRCTKAHEYMFLLSKADRYYFDADAIAEPSVKGNAGSRFNAGKTALHGLGRSSEKDRIERDSRNRRSVWTVATQPYSGAHFAVMPPALVEPCILAGSRPGDVCLDPFSGSGTVAAVATSLGRLAIGIELNPEYQSLAFERIKEAQRQPDLFHQIDLSA